MLQCDLCSTLADFDDCGIGSNVNPISALLLRANRGEGSLDVDVRRGIGQLAVQHRAVDHTQAKHLFAKFDELGLALAHDADKVSGRELDLSPRRSGCAN